MQVEFSDGKKTNTGSDEQTTDHSQGSILSFQDINYKVKVGKPFNKVEKVILRNVTGVFEPGLNAIMGPTGGGKTSLLDLLAKRKDATGLEGSILLNGLPVPKNFRLLAGLDLNL